MQLMAVATVDMAMVDVIVVADAVVEEDDVAIGTSIVITVVDGGILYVTVTY